LRKQGYLAGGEGSDKSLQAVLKRLARKHPELQFPLTETAKFCTAHDALIDIAPQVPFVQKLLEYRETEKLLGSFIGKMARPVLHPSFNVLARSGRTSSFGEKRARARGIRQPVVLLTGKSSRVGQAVAQEVSDRPGDLVKHRSGTSYRAIPAIPPRHNSPMRSAPSSARCM
jgi:hypothetical protein